MVSEDKRRRLIQLLGMTGSAHDGEALNAIRLFHRALGSMAMTCEEFANGGSAPSQPTGYTEAAVRQVVTEAYDKGFQDGITKTLAKMKTAPAPGRRAPTTWQGFARELRDNYEDDLTEWEQGFVESFIERGFPTPTPKQQAIFERMADKCGLECPQ